MSQEDFEQFGVPAENIRAAEKWATKHRKKYQYQVRVPSRKEVRTLPPRDLTQLLMGWMAHSPIEIIPSKVQIELVLELLDKRADAEQLGEVVAMCRNYVSGQ